MLAALDRLEDRRRELEGRMAEPESYSDGARMRELTRAHTEVQEEHAKLMARWEELSGFIAEGRQQIGGLRSGKASL